MSLGSISRQKRISDLQFVGDLAALFLRHGIESGDPSGPAKFESYLVSKDNFRSQLFTLCTAISHMSDADLTGEQLLGLIARALGVPEAPDEDDAVALPESMKAAFLNGYGAWSNRDLYDPAPWPPSREPVPNEPIPFPQPAEALAETSEKRPPEVRAAGTRTMQEALLMARKQAPFELPARSAPTAEVNVDNLTINELTRLLEDIERRMSRVKPHLHEQKTFDHPPDQAPDEAIARQAKVREFSEVYSSRAGVAAAQLRPALVTPPTAIALSPSEATGIAVPHAPIETASDIAREDAFLARHTYLRTGRRLPPDIVVPIPRTASPPVLVEVAKVPDISAPAEITLGLASNPDRFRIKLNLAIGVIAAIVLVGSPMAGFMAYRLLHPTYVIEYQDVRQPVVPDTDVAMPAPTPNSAIPASSPAAKLANPKSNATPSPKAAHAGQNSDARNLHQAKRTAAVAVWPPPLQK